MGDAFNLLHMVELMMGVIMTIFILGLIGVAKMARGNESNLIYSWNIGTCQSDVNSRVKYEKCKFHSHNHLEEQEHELGMNCETPIMHEAGLSCEGLGRCTCKSPMYNASDRFA
ncbi:hypothetical protein GcM3_01480 [Golovinomyces cichoracearum]|uniref:Uncharacterized protein n=1 Tax=Golovinomyces cichoracearum TaxID=62708 RepID=A0A420HLH4_9PEZI|nr:hypothetical protein GcM3_01480 [Golovinomyces cichoracearum]